MEVEPWQFAQLDHNSCYSHNRLRPWLPQFRWFIFLGLPVADDLRNLALLDGLAGPNRSLANPYGNCRAGFDRLVSRVGLVATKP